MRKIPFLLLLFFPFIACQNKPQPAAVNATPKAAKPAEPDWVKNAVLYECNVRQFSRDGNFAGVQRELPRLQALGINVLWLMPIHPIGRERRKGTLGSPYSVQDYLAVNPDYGTLDDLKSLVQSAHSLGIKVILDWVPNHTSWDAAWKSRHPEYYSRYKGDFTVPLNEHGEPIEDWTDVCDLDYNNPGLRQAMIGAMQYWLRNADVDGFRVDMAGLVPNDFWAQARPALDSVKPVFMLAEWQDEPAHFTSAFNANYGWKWKDVTKDIAAGKQNAESLDTLLRFLDDFYPKDYFQLYFTQNHDENTHNGTEAELYGPAADAFNILAFTWQGIPMLYNGQEDNLTQRLAFFERNPIHWGKMSKTPFFQKLTGLRQHNQAVWAGKNGGNVVKIPSSADDFVYAFQREKNGDRVVVILNLSKESRSFTLKAPEAVRGAYTDLFGSSTVQITGEMELRLNPWGYLVLTNK